MPQQKIHQSKNSSYEQDICNYKKGIRYKGKEEIIYYNDASGSCHDGCINYRSQPSYDEQGG
jgi:hypothetical protein